jgi:hypothetical protein
MTCLVRSVPKRGYWLIGIWLYPIVSLMVAAVILLPIAALLGHHVTLLQTIASWLAVTLGVSAWAYTHDYRRLHFTLTPDALLFGRGAYATVIPFSEIESIVMGLPDKLPWWIRSQRFGGRRDGTYQMHVAYWKSVPVLKLRGSRYLPLSAGTIRLFMRDYDTLVAELLRLNESKIVGRETWDDREADKLTAARYNTIITIKPLMKDAKT